MLSPDIDLVRQANSKDTYVANSIAKLEEKFAFKASVQYTGNFLCHDVRHFPIFSLNERMLFSLKMCLLKLKI